MGTVGYTPNEVYTVSTLHRKIRNADIESRIKEIRDAMDTCDDIQMREHLAKKLKAERHKLQVD